MPEGNGLAAFVAQVTGEDHLRVEDDLGHGFVRLRSAEAERRQAKHDIRGSEDIVIEMLRNARDAGASRILVASSLSGTKRTIVMLDDGCGVPDGLHERIFEARVTSKLDTVHMDQWGVHGRGMALYAVSVNATRAFVAATQEGGGTSIRVETDTTSLPEKRDQSTPPVFSASEGGTVTARGPRNILRTVAEFAYVERDSCTVYLGSAAEVCATLWSEGRRGLSAVDRVFSTPATGLPILKRLAAAATPAELRSIAASLGLEVSERTARRIMDGQIAPLAPIGVNVMEAISGNAGTARRAPRAPATARDCRGLHIAAGDMEPFKQAVAAAFADLADAYFLDKDVQPSVSVRGDALHVSVPIRKLD